MKNVRIVNETGDVHDTKVYDAETGCQIHGIVSIDVRYRVDDVVRADVQLLGVIESTAAEARFVMAHPDTGDVSEVRCIEFADGSKWDAKVIGRTTISDRFRAFVLR